MNVPKIWIKIICLMSFFGQIYTDIDSKEYFCGKKLVKTLNELCAIYNNPTSGRNRFRRQIVQECCRSQCSRRYLVQYYCLEANSSIINLLKAKPEVSNKSKLNLNKNYQSNVNAIARAEDRNGLTRVKKARQLKASRPVPPPNIGIVENSQKPFYIWKFSKIR